MAPKASMALLFHPKKTPRKETQVASPKPGPSNLNKAKPVPKVEDDEDEGLKLPEAPFMEFKLLSSALNGWRYDIMKFDSRRPVDIHKWTPPVKLNRKDLRRDEGSANAPPEAVGPMLGADGKPVIGVDGKMVMVDAEGRPIHPSGAAGGSKDKGKAGGAKKRFQRKTRQVFFVPDEVRQLRREERYPWVLEDSSPTQNEVWTGQMDDATKAETHALFMPAANQNFKFVPTHRWYKFQKRLKHDLPTDLVNVESLYNQNQKRDPQQWLASRKGKAVSTATAAMFKAESGGGGGSGSQSLGPGGRKLKVVDSGMDHLFDDGEDGDGSQRRRKRELGEDGDLDEQVFEEDFADDDEKMEVDEDDEEAKELEERLKKEYKNANKTREAGVDESDDDEETGPTKQQKAMQKLIRKQEGNDAYDSEDEQNPYFSGEEEEEEEEEVVGTATAAIQEQQQQQQLESRSQTPKPTARPVVNGGTPAPGSRAASPTVSPGHGGHSVVAKRATSPKVPKPKANISRGNSPLGGQSPLGGSRATSPVADMSNDQKTGMKRKADESPEKPATNNPVNGGVPSKPKKRKPAPAVSPITVSPAELESMLLAWLKSTTNATTRDCIHHFTPYLTDREKKDEFSAMVRKHASLKGGILSLKRAGSSAPSPPAS
ncbi:Transcription initiation factor IIF subunit alpha [Psilocybe cubensis]|uniref:Transcription initiation factor IIF subunit alpha n=2 Tax=Psilocybe cubensis TaxID=181762 RepID=A0ACB8H471_PSICU|nr:Transcription initiation factor IIF subunit alpha [Psilocybe cubensis]KAH9482649.1 Transcription initiation factor IIF subunit alpha [Psilocybe cubensis]